MQRSVGAKGRLYNVWVYQDRDYSNRDIPDIPCAAHDLALLFYW